MFEIVLAEGPLLYLEKVKERPDQRSEFGKTVVAGVELRHFFHQHIAYHPQECPTVLVGYIIDRGDEQGLERFVDRQEGFSLFLSRSRDIIGRNNSSGRNRGLLFLSGKPGQPVFLHSGRGFPQRRNGRTT